MTTAVEVLACPHCDRMFNAVPAIYGKAIRCRGCRKPFQIPADPKTAELSPEPSEPQPEPLVAVECVIDGTDARQCPTCGRPFSMQARFVGKTIRCRGCRVPFVVTATKQKASAREPAEPRPAAQSNEKAVVQPSFAKPPAPVAEAEPEEVADTPPVVYEDGGDVLDVVPGGEQVLVAVRPRRLPPRQASTMDALAPIIAIVLGGLMALPLTQLILWFGLGMDPLKLGRVMPSSLRWIVPINFQRGR